MTGSKVSSAALAVAPSSQNGAPETDMQLREVNEAEAHRLARAGLAIEPAQSGRDAQRRSLVQKALGQLRKDIQAR